MPSLAEVLNTLFQRHTKDGKRKAYSNEDVASWARSQGIEMSQTHVWNLRQLGRPSDPRVSHIKIIGEFFGYQPGYFIDPQVYWEVERRIARDRHAPGDAEVDVPSQPAASRVMLRKVAKMSPESQALIQGLIDQVSVLEQGSAQNGDGA